MQDSDIKKEACGQAQPDLFPAKELEAIEIRMRQAETEQAGQYTLERFKERRPDAYRLCIHLLASNYGRLRVAQLLRCSHHTVQAVADEAATPIAIEKERLASVARHGASMLLEAVADDVADPVKRDKISTRDKGIVAGVLIDKALVLQGQASVIVGTEKREFSQEDMNAYLDGLDQVPAKTGTRAETRAQKGGPRPPAEGEILDEQTVEPGDLDDQADIEAAASAESDLDPDPGPFAQGESVDTLEPHKTGGE